MTTRQIWIISDTHFNHANIIKYCDRPFKDPAQMNEVMIENWNAVIKPTDIVYHLGDVYMGDKQRAGEILRQLHGRKRLVLGNHDTMEDGILHKAFEKTLVWRYFKEEKILLSHIPLHPSSFVGGPEAATRNIHGHIHEKQVLLPDGSIDPRYRCLCVEHTEYKPVPIEEAYSFTTRKVAVPAVTPPAVSTDQNPALSRETDWGHDVGRENI
jgi:calcineurin-like phosphoesterase family protein